jgi:oxygen-independent coproporphyrinogen-3 oxidase
VITRDGTLPARWLETIASEIANVREAIPESRRATQLHWGGGTPTHLSCGQMRGLFAALTDAFPLTRDAEVSLEVDPRVTTREQIDTLRELGFTRISMGVQDFDPRVQQAIHRNQPVAVTAALVEWARGAGFESTSFDLIYGLPFQNEAGFGHTLDEVLALEPDRVALYSYAHVTWVAKQQRGFERHDLPDAATKLRLFLQALRRFLDAGYVYVGMDHFAKPDDELVRALRTGRLRRNFMGYTTQAGVELLGFGPSAISELRGAFAQNQRELPAWENAIAQHGVATLRGHRLSFDDQRRRFVIMRIMCHGALQAQEYREVFGEEFVSVFADELARLGALEDDGLVVRLPDGGLGVTPLGRLLVRNVAMLFDAYLPEQQRSGRPLFSRAV